MLGFYKTAFFYNSVPRAHSLGATEPSHSPLSCRFSRLRLAPVRSPIRLIVWRPFGVSPGANTMAQATKPPLQSRQHWRQLEDLALPALPWYPWERYLRTSPSKYSGDHFLASYRWDKMLRR